MATYMWPLKADAVAATYADGDEVFVGGGTVLEDAVMGWYKYFASSTTADGADVIDPVAGGSGRLLRVTRGPLVAGANIIGKVGVDQTTPGTTNLVASGQSGTWTVQPGNTANTTAWKVDGSAVTQPVSSATLATAASQTTIIGHVDGIEGLLTTIDADTSVLSAAVRAEDAVHNSADTGIFALVVRKDSAASLANADGDYTGLQVDASGNLRVTGGGGGTQYAEDAAHTTADIGTMALVVRKDSAATIATTDGDYTALQVDADGYLRVSGKGGGETAHDAVGTGTNPLLIGGYASAAAPTAVSADGDATRGWFLLNGAQATVLTAAGALIGGDATNGLDVDVTRLPALAAGTNNIGDVDVLTVPAPLSTTGGGTQATALRVTVASDSTGVLAVTDNAGSLTVDGTVAATQSGTWTVQPGNTANTTAWKVDGSAVTQPVSGTVTINAIPTGSNTIGNIGTIATAMTPGTGAGNLGKAEDAVHGSGDTGVFALVVRKDTAATIATTDGDYTGMQTDATGNLRVVSIDAGDVAHDAADSGNPIKIGGRARTTERAAAATDDRVDAVFDVTGKLIVLPYANPENFVSGAITTAMTATTSTSLVAAPAAGLRNYITTIVVSNAHATVGTDVIIQDGSGGTTLMTIPAAAVYGGAGLTLPTPLRQPTTATALFCANVTTGASTKVSVVGYKGA